VAETATKLLPPPRYNVTSICQVATQSNATIKLLSEGAYRFAARYIVTFTRSTMPPIRASL